MYDLITIGDITIDLYFKGNTLTEKDDRFFLAIGGKYVADHFYESVGGGAANVAIGASNHGLNTAVVGFVGENSFKQIILQKLIKKSVSTEFILFLKNFLNLSSILISSKGERTIIHYLTPYDSLNLSNDFKKNLLKTKLVYFGNLPHLSLSEKQELLSYFKENKIKTTLNLGVSDCRRPFSEVKKIINLTDLLIINGHEYAELIKEDYQKINWNLPLEKKLGYKDQILVITDGPNGSHLYQNGKIIHQKAVKPSKIVDTTGAGDAFTAAFIASFIKGKTLPECLNHASHYATKILEKIGAN